MLTRIVSWTEFRALMGDSSHKRTLLFRGQARTSWSLEPSLFRLARRPTLATYLAEIVPAVADVVAASLDVTLDLARPADLGRLLSILQRFDFPSPLLDWTRSPLIAAYFAFSDRRAGDTDQVAIWQLDVGVPEFAERPLDVLAPHPSDHPALVAQSGFHLRFSAECALERMAPHQEASNRALLTRFDLPAADARLALAELAGLGIDAARLFPGADAVCQRLEQDLAFERRQRFPR